MGDIRHNSGANDALSSNTESEMDFELWKHPNYYELIPFLTRFMKRYPLLLNDVADYTKLIGSSLRSAVRGGKITLVQVNRLLAHVQEHPGLTSSDEQTWHMALFLAVYLYHQRSIIREKHQGFWEMQVIRNVYGTLSRAYDVTKELSDEMMPSLPHFVRAWEEAWGWINPLC